MNDGRNDDRVVSFGLEVMEYPIDIFFGCFSLVSDAFMPRGEQVLGDFNDRFGSYRFGRRTPLMADKRERLVARGNALFVWCRSFFRMGEGGSDLPHGDG